MVSHCKSMQESAWVCLCAPLGITSLPGANGESKNADKCAQIVSANRNR